jgi:hypothetical protein
VTCTLPSGIAATTSTTKAKRTQLAVSGRATHAPNARGIGCCESSGHRALSFLADSLAALPSIAGSWRVHRENSADLRRFFMELAGLEPATSWVRSRRSPPHLPQKLRRVFVGYSHGRPRRLKRRMQNACKSRKPTPGLEPGTPSLRVKDAGGAAGTPRDGNRWKQRVPGKPLEPSESGGILIGSSRQVPSAREPFRDG